MFPQLKAPAVGPTSNLHGCWNHRFSDTGCFPSPAGRKDTDILAAGSGSYRPVDSCVVLWLVEWLMIMNLCFELVAVAVGLAAIAVDFLNSLMIVCYSRPSTLDR